MITIRVLNSANAALYQQLPLQGLQESPTAFGASYEDEADRSLSEVAARVTPAPGGSLCVLGAFADEQLIGLVAVLRPRREKLRHSAELAGMYVAPAFRRHGVGHALLAAAIEHARTLKGVRQIKLAINADNTAARALPSQRISLLWH